MEEIEDVKRATKQVAEELMRLRRTSLRNGKTKIYMNFNSLEAIFKRVQSLWSVC